jgi:ribosomal protein S18 acetylase RimI-like enzyme
MSLPIFHEPAPLGQADLLRLFLRSELHWGRPLADETTLSVGTAFANPELAQVADANRILDAALPERMTPAQAVDQVEAHFRSRGTRCAYWVMNPSAGAARTEPLAHLLIESGYTAQSCDVMLLDRRPHAMAEVAGLTIIPARASYRHVRELAAESAGQFDCPQLVDAAESHLDDPHWDALLALRDGRAVAMGGVLSVGELGRINDLYVSTAFRRRGFARTLMSRLLEVCARSLFRTVLLDVMPDNIRAIDLYAGLGFRKIASVVSYRAPRRSGE